MSRYNLRSQHNHNVSISSQAPAKIKNPSRVVEDVVFSDSSVSKPEPPPTKRSRISQCRRKILKKPKSAKHRSDTTIYDLPPDVLLHIATFLDTCSLLSFYRTCHWFKDILEDFDPFWKVLCIKEEFSNYEGLVHDDGKVDKIGWAGNPMKINPQNMSEWRKIFLRGLQMRRNILSSNFEGWRIYANKSVPLTKMSPNFDVFQVYKKMGSLTKLAQNDDIKIDWDEKHLVVFHFFRSNTETCTIWVYNIEAEPRFMYSLDKGIECTTDRVVVYKNHVVIIPSWPLSAQAVVMTLSIEDQMKPVGKYFFDQDGDQANIDEFWMHTVLRVVKDKAVVTCRIPSWVCLIVELPSCNLLKKIDLDAISTEFDCQQIWSYMNMAVVLFSEVKKESSNILVTLDINGSSTSLRSVHQTQNIVDVALLTEPEEIYLVKRCGNVMMYNATTKQETMRIENKIFASSTDAASSSTNQTQNNQEGEYQLFVNRREEICVMQSSADVNCGRYIKVYDYYSCNELYTINLDLWKYGMSRDESVCMYTNQTFLAAANSKKLLLFDVKSGRHLGAINIPSHIERALGKDDGACMYEPTGLNLFIFDEDKLIAVHDYERSFPAVLDVYKFW